MTSSQIQDGGRPVISKSNAYISENDEIMKWYTESNSDYDKNDLTRIQIFKFKMADGRHVGKNRFCLQRIFRFSRNFYEDRKVENSDGRMSKFLNFENSRYRTIAILTIVIKWNIVRF